MKKKGGEGGMRDTTVTTGYRVRYIAPLFVSPQENVDVEGDLISDLGAVRRETAGEISGFCGIEKSDFLSHQRTEKLLPHTDVHPGSDDSEDAPSGE